MDHYEVLGIPRNSTRKEIRQAYIKLSQKYHPDKNRSENSEEKFKQIHKAYEVLYDPVKRREYDNKSSMKYLRDPQSYARQMWEEIIKKKEKE